jgi:hypothetical protein
MGWNDSTRKKTGAIAAYGLGLLFGRFLGYHRRYITLRLTAHEAYELLEGLDSWLEGFQDSATDADDDEIPGLYQSFATVSDLRARLWKEVSK